MRLKGKAQSAGMRPNGIDAQPRRVGVERVGLDKESGAARANWIVRALADYFRSEMKAGRMNEMDPRVAARIWLGSLRHIVMIETLGTSIDELSTEDFLDGLVDMFCPAKPVKPRKK